MGDYRFYHPVEVRYGDLDPQGHLNNAKYLTYFEQARIQYIRSLGLWNSVSFLDIGIILAEIKISFRSPVQFGQPVRVGARVTRLGNKSMDMSYSLEDSRDARELASCSSVLVTYDYTSGQTIPIPAFWRTAIQAFENNPPGAQALEDG